MSTARLPLYERLPEIYRIRDSEQKPHLGGALTHVCVSLRRAGLGQTPGCALAALASDAAPRRRARGGSGAEGGSHLLEVQRQESAGVVEMLSSI